MKSILNFVDSPSFPSWAVSFAVCAIIALGGMITNAHSQVMYPTQKDPCYGGMVINTVDVPFCIAERAGINFDSVKISSSVDVPPIKDRWFSSWTPVNYDDGVRVCVAASVADQFYREIPTALLSSFITIKPALGRTCWKF